MCDWIKTSNCYPQHEQTVLARFWHEETQKYYELNMIFIDCEDYRAWRGKHPEGITIITVPHEWKPLPTPPKDES